MAGAGKTACALELAYHQRRSPRFRGFVCHEAPREGSEIEGALSKLALDMEKQLPGFKMAHLVDRAEDFRAWLPVLSEMLEQNSVLIVLDNLENLLTDDGCWKDDRWGWLVKSLLDHEGLSRIILTSRKLPKELVENGRLLIEPINALSLNEAALLAREMPHLGRLLLGKISLGLEKGRELVKRTLSLIQGHPKLIELADAQATDPATLEKYLERAVGAWSDSESHLDRFFKDGESAQTAEEFLKVLTRWTKDVSGSLPESSRTLFRFICALEDEDRQDWIVKQVWPDLWKALGYSSDALGLDQALSAIKSAGLADTQLLGEQVKYAIHPGVAQADLEEVDEKFRSAVDSEMASFWISGFNQAISGEQEMGQLVVRAGLSSAPYLMRLKRWDEASILLGEATLRDRSPKTIASVLPLIRHIARVSKGTDRELIDAGNLAIALHFAGRWQEAEEMLRFLMPRFVSRGDFEEATRLAGSLFYILLHTGRFEEALKQAVENKDYTIQAGLGPWTLLSEEVHRLQALNALGRYEEVLKCVDELRVQMSSLLTRGDKKEYARPWNVREGVLDAGRGAAKGAQKWEEALELNAERVEIKKSRGATELELAQNRFSDTDPLRALKRHHEALEMILECKEIYEREKYIPGLGRVFAALANLEGDLGNLDRAICFGEDFMRNSYLAGNTEDISLSHINQAIFLSKTGPDKVLAHDLAGGMICYLTQSGLQKDSLSNLLIDLAEFGSRALPSSFDQVCSIVDEVEGVRFRELFRNLAGPDADGDQVMRAVIDLIPRGHT